MGSLAAAGVPSSRPAARAVRKRRMAAGSGCRDGMADRLSLKPPAGVSWYFSLPPKGEGKSTKQPRRGLGAVPERMGRAAKVDGTLRVPPSGTRSVPSTLGPRYLPGNRSRSAGDWGTVGALYRIGGRDATLQAGGAFRALVGNWGKVFRCRDRFDGGF